ncbi:HisA/HisF-related TIM barrel protein [Rhodoferax sp.]|uniref:HisA/HisF-related TIM barrel protein n=1 Tax=Rhodoferax sp. TaxID=50421 RepID=UPI00271F16F8|nr:HisA/HisF-related TIM barrel protein [Rhodoferax sp.]MDO8317948.1 HisA/HisF-related TIM barrel protein [Rhodoferax sp.]
MSVQFCCLAKNFSELNPVVPSFVCCTPRMASMPNQVMNAQVLLAGESELVATALLNAGARKVFLGEIALFDSTVVTRLVHQFGTERIGLQVPVQRQSVSWSFETESNEDFHVVTPSLCDPVWEVLKANGETSGVRAAGWIDAMLHHGVSTVLLRADISDDADLNLCAGLVESLANRLWVAPLNDLHPPIADWVAFGQVRQLALPAALYHRRHALVPRGSAASGTVLTA